MLPFIGKTTRSLVVEIGEAELRLLAVLENGNRRKIVHAFVENITDLTEIEISQKLAACVKSKAFKPTKVVILHPAHNLTTRIMSLPSTDPKEIEGILELQAVKQTPYAREEISIGFDILSKDESGYSQVLLAISHNDVSSRYYRIVEMAGYHASNVSLVTQGTRYWYEKVGKAHYSAEDQVVMLVDVDTSSSELLFMKGKTLFYTRSLGYGGKQLASDESLRRDFLSDIHRTMDTASTDAKIEKVDKILVTGAEESLSQAVSAITGEMNILCVKQSCTEGAQKLIRKKAAETITAHTGSFVSLVGFALDSRPVVIDLIPSDVLLRKGLESRAKDLALLGTLLLAFVMVVSAIGFQKVYRTTSYLDSLKEEYRAIKAESADIERLVAKMKIAGEQRNQKGDFLDVMYDITDVIPQNMYLTSVQFSARERNTVIRGISEDMSSVFQFLSTLEAAPNLEMVKTRNVTKRKVEDRDVSEFEIVANLKGSVISGETA